LRSSRNDIQVAPATATSEKDPFSARPNRVRNP